MHTLYLFALLGFLLASSLSQTTFYVDETNKTKNPDGSRDHPFASLDEAVFRLSPGTFDIILLGQSTTITSQVIFPEGSICTIMPQTIPENGYYPLKLGIGASIGILHTNVTFKDVQLIELYLNRGSGPNAITLSGGFLSLNRTLVADIHYEESDIPSLFPNSPPPFISAEGSSAFISRRRTTGLILSDTKWKNLVNVRIYTMETQVIVQNASFENIEMDNYAFWNLWFGDLKIFNMSLWNARFTTKFGSKEDENDMGFMVISGAYVNVSMNTFSAKNISIMNSLHLIGRPGHEDGASPTMVEIWDVILEDIIETENEQYEQLEEFMGSSELTGGVGLIFDILGPTKLTVRNFTARNMKLEKGPLFKYMADPDSYGLPPKFSLQDIKIFNSSNPSFFFLWMGNGQIEDVELINVESLNFAMFYFDTATTVAIENTFTRNLSGSFASLQYVSSQNLKNLTFHNVSTYQKNLILLKRETPGSDLRALANADQSTLISDIFIDGSEYIGAQNPEEKVFLMRIEGNYGIVLIKNSIWMNLKTGSLQSSHMNVLKVDNLTVNGVSTQAAEIFRFESFDFVKIVNSRFEKNENQGGIVIVDVPKYTQNKAIGFMVSFENISVLENNAKYEENNNSLLTNLFEFKSPRKLIQTEFINCLFQDNNISGSVIKVTESQSINVTLENNIFLKNYARGPGGIFSTENLQENSSVLIANNNLFQDNFCQENGGIFYFVDVWYQVSLTNNTYQNNTSAENGGIGYIEQTNVSLLEQHSLYSENTARKDGGLWFIRSNNQLQNTQPPISFTNTVFKNSLSGFNGGAFYLSDGNLSIESSSFTKIQAEESGGVFFLEAFSSLFINDSTFGQLTASEGSLVFAVSLDKASLVLQDTTINNVTSLEEGGTLVNVNSGLIVVNNSEISEISGQLLFDLKGSSVKFDGARISDIDCLEVKEACVVDGESVMLEWEDTEIKNVVLQGDLVVLDEKSVEKGEVIIVNITKGE